MPATIKDFIALLNKNNVNTNEFILATQDKEAKPILAQIDWDKMLQNYQVFSKQFTDNSWMKRTWAFALLSGNIAWAKCFHKSTLDNNTCIHHPVLFAYFAKDINFFIEILKHLEINVRVFEDTSLIKCIIAAGDSRSLFVLIDQCKLSPLHRSETFSLVNYAIAKFNIKTNTILLDILKKWPELYYESRSSILEKWPKDDTQATQFLDQLLVSRCTILAEQLRLDPQSTEAAILELSELGKDSRQAASVFEREWQLQLRKLIRQLNTGTEKQQKEALSTMRNYKPLPGTNDAINAYLCRKSILKAKASFASLSESFTKDNKDTFINDANEAIKLGANEAFFLYGEAYIQGHFNANHYKRGAYYYFLSAQSGYELAKRKLEELILHSTETVYNKDDIYALDSIKLFHALTLDTPSCHEKLASLINSKLLAYFVKEYDNEYRRLPLGYTLLVLFYATLNPNQDDDNANTCFLNYVVHALKSAESNSEKNIGDFVREIKDILYTHFNSVAFKLLDTDKLSKKQRVSLLKAIDRASLSPDQMEVYDDCHALLPVEDQFPLKPLPSVDTRLDALDTLNIESIVNAFCEEQLKLLPRMSLDEHLTFIPWLQQFTSKLKQNFSSLDPRINTPEQNNRASFFFQSFLDKRSESCKRVTLPGM